MTTLVLEQVSVGQYLLKGELNMYSVPQLFVQSQSQFASAKGDVHVDLAGVTRSDSAGLALLLAWLRMAKDRELTMHYRNLPEQMRQIARVSELDSLLPIVE